MAKRAVKESDNGIEKEDNVMAAKSDTDQAAQKDVITGKRAIKKALKGLYSHDIESEHDDGTITFYTVDSDSDGHERRSDGVSFDIEELRSTVPHFVEMLGSPDAFCMLAEELGGRRVRDRGVHQAVFRGDAGEIARVPDIHI